MPISKVGLRGVAAFAGAMIIAIPLSVSAQARCMDGSKGICKRPMAAAQVHTTYRYRTVDKVSNVNRYRNVTRTSYRNIVKTKFHDIHKVKYKDITHTRYVRHINRVVTVTRVQPIVRVHTITRVHRQVIARVHTQVIPRVHVSVIPRVHTRTVVLRSNQFASETKWLPTRYAMGGSSVVMAGTSYRTVMAGSSFHRARFASNNNGKLRLMNYVKPSKHSSKASQ